MTIGFIKNDSLLEEKVSENDYLGISSSIKTLSEKLSSINNNTMIGIVGTYGIGKSTLISKTKSARQEEDETWIHFDAWQFPERKELWDGLILETARQMGELKNIKQSLEGNKNDDKELMLKAGLGITKIALPFFIPAIELVGEGLKHFLQETPAKRVFEMQEVFVELLKKFNTNKIIFVLEDVDRSGQDGLFFLETFRQFLSNDKIDKQIIVITPISNYYEKLDTYLKCLDYVEFFRKKDNYDLSNFISNIYDSNDEDEKKEYKKKILEDFILSLYKRDALCLRKIKLILRQANLNYIELKSRGYDPDDLVCIAVEASKYIPYDGTKDNTLFNEYKISKKLYTNNEIHKMIFLSSLPASASAYMHEHYEDKFKLENINLIKNNNCKFKTPTQEVWTDKKYYLADFYFNEL